jgi:flap endonuclease-1
MGIRYLNRFLKDNASPSIKLCNLAELSDKKIAVDISIYMYRFISDDTLIENIYLMLSIFRHYNIIPIFVFDGKPPPEKRELLQKRQKDKQEAENEYNILKNTLEINKDIDDYDKQEIIYNMDMLKKKFVTINKNDIENIKNLIRAYGATYYDAPGEADKLCAMLNIKDKVWACLSEDMDMFVYGCPRVIRYLSLLNHTAVIYNLKGILNNLGISQKELRDICVLSGTDYNLEYNDNKNTLNNTLKLFKKYRKTRTNLSFYEWLNENPYRDYIKDYELLIKICDMFDLNIAVKDSDIKIFEKIKIPDGNGTIIKYDLINILKTDGFIISNII